MTSSPPPRASVQEVREALRSLGYLDSSIDRFVLAGVGGPSLAKTCLKTASRVGLAAGPLLGAAVSLATLGLDPRLLREPSDVVVLAAYAVVVLGLLAGLAAFVGALLVAYLGKRMGPRSSAALSRGVGLALAMAGLAYLALWWRSRGLFAPFALQALALTVSLALGIVLARFGSLAAVAVLSSSGQDRLPKASLSRRHVVASVGLGGLLAAAGVGVSYSLEHTDLPPPDYAVVPTGLRVKVVGIDGLERRMTEQMVARGEMPNLESLLRVGASGRLAVEPERVPAIVWTTIATGRGPESHGVVSTGARRLAGMRTPVSPGGRLASALGDAADLLRLTRKEPPTALLSGVKTFWSAASEKGLKVGIVNWWATWPAEAVNGFVVSDRAFFKLERKGALDREVSPAGAYARLASLPGGEGLDLPRRLDTFAIAALSTLGGGAAFDLEAVYLPGLDIFTSQSFGSAAQADLAGLGARLDGLRSYYRFVDSCLGELSRGLTQGDVLVVLGDPGRLAREAALPPEGILVIAGGPARPGALGAVSERDLAPTVLHLVGLPTSRELRGRVLEAAFDPGFCRAHPVRTVSSLGRRPTSRAAQSDFDAQMLEELKSLGYVR